MTMLALSNHRRAANKAQKTSLPGGFFVCAILMTLSVSTSALAQDTRDETDLSAITLPQSSASKADGSGLSYNLPRGPVQTFDNFNSFSNSTFDLPALDLPINAVGSTLFKLDVSNPSCLSGAGRCERRTDRLSLGLSEYISAKKDNGIDFALRPRASFRFDDESSSAVVGAVVEIGEDLRRGSDMKTNTWYFFAGADAEALTYSPDGMRQLSSGRFHLQDRIIVGDAQAGLGYRIGDADLSLSYLRREASAEGFSYNEDAAALSFTWKR
jgi:hypothetical protein